MGKGQKNKNRSNKKAKPSDKPDGAIDSTGAGNTSAPTSESGQGSSGTPATQAHSALENKVPVKNCHFVPQWILKNFAWQEGPQNSRFPRVNYFDIKKQQLSRPLVKNVYAKKDLFKDPDNPPGVVTHKIEEELGQLESKASRTFKEIRVAVSNRDKNPRSGAAPRSACVKLKRKFLEDLRRFLFVMYYHQISVGKTFYNEEHPENARLQAWIKTYRERNRLSTSPEDIWLHILRHYLRADHADLMKQGEKVEQNRIQEIFAKLGPDWHSRGMSVMPDIMALYKSMEVDPNLEEWKSLPYYDNMKMFLVIWEAAPGEEFLMSDNSFGLYEGRTDEAGPLHRIYVVSPKIALVVCHPGLKDTSNLLGFVKLANPFRLTAQQCSTSMLLNAPHPGANVMYKNTPPSSSHTTILYGNAGAAHPDPEDEFEIQICVLSEDDTHTVNGIILYNVLDEGKITFGSKDAALRTLVEFGKNKNFQHKRKLKYASLARKLSEDPDVRQNAHFNPQLFEPQATAPPLRFPPLSARPGTFWETTLMVYHTLHKAQSPQSTSYKLWEKVHSQAFTVPRGTRADPRPARLVPKMDDKLAHVLFEVCSGVLNLIFGKTTKQEVYLEQLIITFLDHLLKNNRPLFDEMERNVIRILRESYHQPGPAMTARIKIYINPGDDDNIPVPAGFQDFFDDSEAVVDRPGYPHIPAMVVYAVWSVSRINSIRQTM